VAKLGASAPDDVVAGKEEKLVPAAVAVTMLVVAASTEVDDVCVVGQLQTPQSCML
jgi:hypothetical protein